MQPARNIFWIASFPKSGNSWLLTILHNILLARGYDEIGTNHGFFDIYTRESQNLGIPPALDIFQPYTRITNATFLKTHSIFKDEKMHFLHDVKTSGFILVLRNPLDVLFSYINYTRGTEYKLNKNNRTYQRQLFNDFLGFEKPIPFDEWSLMTLSDIPEKNISHAFYYFFVNNMSIPTLSNVSSSWVSHTLSWHIALENYQSLLFRYEDLIEKNDNFLYLKKFFAFETDEIYQGIKKQQNYALDQKKKKNYFYNRMESYYYRDFLTKKQIDLFKRTYFSILKKFNYHNIPSE